MCEATHCIGVAEAIEETSSFKTDNLPPTNEFFSITMYGSDTNFVANDSKRYSIGDRTPGVVKGNNSTITVYIQPNQPTAQSERANWLPSPPNGSFYLILRTHGPRQPIIDQVWAPPAVTPQ